MTAIGRVVLLVAVSGMLSAQARDPDPWRPVVHFTPPSNFMNDPNGLVYFEGEYHLFYQHNPQGNEWGHMSWGHAVSRDLLAWEHLPVALHEADGWMIFSGSAVVDRTNTSGLCDDRPGTPTPCLIAVYTAHGHGRQTQNLAFSRDRGRTWTKYAKNPVIDAGMADFRDPKVLWHEPTRRWVMAVALPKEHRIRFYGSADLKAWTALSDFGPAAATGGVWECPDLFPLAVAGSNETKWVLIVSLNPGGVAGGSGTQYFVGAFDGTRFTPEGGTTEPRWADFGKDFYAAQSWSDTPDARRIWVGWMSNWEYANREPTLTWRGAQSLPRELSLRRRADGLTLVQRPIGELSRWRHAGTTTSKVAVGPIPSPLIGLVEAPLELRLTIDPGTARRLSLSIRATGDSAGPPEETSVVYDRPAATLSVDRTRSGRVDFHERFPGRQDAPLRLADGAPLALAIVLDRSSIEVFADDGAVVITDRIFRTAGRRRLEIQAEGGTATVTKMESWRLVRPSTGQP